MVIFEIIVLSYILYFVAESNKESAFKLISFNPLFTVFVLVLNKIFFVLDNTSRILFYFLIIYILGSIFLNLEIKLSFKSITLLKSTLLVITTYMFLGFINSDFFIDKIYNILLIFLISSYFLKNKITLKFIDHKSLSIFFLIFLFTQLNIQNILFKENISNMNINNTTTNLNVVQILFDGLPRSAIDELVKENNTVDYHYYSNFYSTGLNTQNIVTDMFYGRNIDESENYYNYYQQLSDSPDNLINKLNSENINTFLITDRFINDVIFGKMSNKFTNRYINRGEDKDIDSYLRFYENNIPNIYVYDIKPPVIKVFNDYVLDMVNIKKYKTKIIVERGPLIAIDNVSKFYDIYQKTKDVGNNYYFVHLQIPHIPFIMDSDCNYIESEIGVFNNSRSVVNGQVNCAKKLIELLLEKITDENTLLIIHGDHSLNELILSSEELAKNIPPENQVIENLKYIKEKISTGLLIRYPKYNYIEVNNKVENNQIIFMTDFNQFISNFYNNPSSNIKNYEKIEVLNLFGGVAENRNDSNIVKKKIDTKDW